eukprot:Tamp_27818.p2 GENE.Tamp_27818~~Tamp_27818.p2  ORF type:complete len:209 (-),score=35.24 Tamp_27818:213-800(-)
MWAAYARQLQTRPLATKSITSGVLFGVGDVISQNLPSTGSGDRGRGLSEEQGHGEPLDVGRVAWLACFGVVLYAPTNHWWFAFQERNVTAFKSRPAAQAALRVAVHSVVYAPFSVAAFVAWVALREDSAAIVGRVKENTFKLWASGTVFWVPTMLGIYRYVPNQHRVGVTTVCNLAWSTYLSLKSKYRRTSPAAN